MSLETFSGPVSDVHAKRCRVLSKAIELGFISENEPLCMFYDSDILVQFINALKASYPKSVPTFHTVAIKSNPLVSVLKIFRENGIGAEAASYGEVQVALAAGYNPSQIVWDSPAKTYAEIKEGFKLGINMNADNFQELERFITAYREVGIDQFPNIRLGLRINPQCGAGKVADSSTASLYSKFGIGLLDYKTEVIHHFKENRWLNTLHSHTGSQGCKFSLLATVAASLYHLAEEINNTVGFQQVKCIDIGGGIPTIYDSDDLGLNNFSEFVKTLEEICPGLLEGKYEIATENGRSLNTKSGWIASRVEYVKSVHGRPVITQHVGSDILMRTVYRQHDWAMRVFACTKQGKPITCTEDEALETDIGGPLCFSGDLIVRQRRFPKIHQYDHVIIPDAGSYTFALFSRYNSRQAPSVRGYKEVNGEIIFSLHKPRESIKSVVDFWQ